MGGGAIIGPHVPADRRGIGAGAVGTARHPSIPLQGGGNPIPPEQAALIDRLDHLEQCLKRVRYAQSASRDDTLGGVSDGAVTPWGWNLDLR